MPTPETSRASTKAEEGRPFLDSTLYSNPMASEELLTIDQMTTPDSKLLSTIMEDPSTSTRRMGTMTSLVTPIWEPHHTKAGLLQAFPILLKQLPLLLSPDHHLPKHFPMDPLPITLGLKPRSNFLDMAS